MISKYQIKEVINNAEHSYEKCWGFLTGLKNFKVNKIDVNIIFEFQPELAETLYQLEKVYKVVHQEKKHLINRKEQLSISWFESRMRLLSKHQETIKKTISVGKCIGDAFAWFFYQKDRKYIREHLKQEEVFHFPPGIGGIGELEFIKNVRSLHNYLVIYHGITSFLRLGDVTLIDVSTFRVAGIGELKSNSKEKGKVEISLIFSGPGIDINKIQKSILETKVKTRKMNVPLPSKMQARLERQMKSIGSSFKSMEIISENKIKKNADYSFKKLEELLYSSKRYSFVYKKASEGLLLISYMEKRKSLYSRLSSEKIIDFNTKMDELIPHTKLILNESRNDNSIFIHTLLYDKKYKSKHMLGMTPFFWWPIDPSLIKKVIFHEIFIFTVFNPSHLMKKIEQIGYTTKLNEKGKHVAYRKIGDKRIELQGMFHYFRMIQEYLFTEVDVADFLLSVDDHMNTLDVNKLTNVELYFEQII